MQPIDSYQKLTVEPIEMRLCMSQNAARCSFIDPQNTYPLVSVTYYPFRDVYIMNSPWFIPNQIQKFEVFFLNRVPIEGAAQCFFINWHQVSLVTQPSWPADSYATQNWQTAGIPGYLVNQNAIAKSCKYPLLLYVLNLGNYLPFIMLGPSGSIRLLPVCTNPSTTYPQLTCQQDITEPLPLSPIEQTDKDGMRIHAIESIYIQSHKTTSYCMRRPKGNMNVLLEPKRAKEAHTCYQK